MGRLLDGAPHGRPRTSHIQAHRLAEGARLCNGSGFRNVSEDPYSVYMK